MEKGKLIMAKYRKLGRTSSQRKALLRNQVTALINNGKIIADEKTENITEAVDDNRKYSVKVCGPQRDVQRALSSISGVISVEATGERELDSYTFVVESQKGVDIRKPIFYAMSQNGYPIIGLEALSMNLEEVFIKIMDKSAK